MAYTCKTCGKAYTQSCTLNRHQRETHEANPAWHKCLECGKKFARKSNLDRHAATAIHAKRPKIENPHSYECGDCGKMVKTRHALIAHLSVHNKAYPCGKCGKLFRAPGRRFKHQSFHCGEPQLVGYSPRRANRDDPMNINSPSSPQPRPRRSPEPQPGLTTPPSSQPSPSHAPPPSPQLSPPTLHPGSRNTSPLSPPSPQLGPSSHPGHSSPDVPQGLPMMEVCVDCVESAINAAQGGASRLELCSALSEGGLTPTIGMLRVVKKLVDIPVYAMIRPRRGTDFVYLEYEIEAMEIDIEALKVGGADGFVFGALTSTRQVDTRVCSRLLKAATPLPCTFHRAFDVLLDLRKGLDVVISLGFNRILTSGAKESACMGVKLIKDLVDKSQDRIVILAGAGITEKNLETVLRETGVKEFHASARSKFNRGHCDSGSVAMGSSDIDSSLMITDKALVKNLVSISKQVWEL